MCKYKRDFILLHRREGNTKLILMTASTCIELMGEVGLVQRDITNMRGDWLSGRSKGTLLCCSRLLVMFMESTSQAGCLFPPESARDVTTWDPQVMCTLALIRQEGGIVLHLKRPT